MPRRPRATTPTAASRRRWRRLACRSGAAGRIVVSIGQLLRLVCLGASVGARCARSVRRAALTGHGPPADGPLTTRCPPSPDAAERPACWGSDGARVVEAVVGLG